MEHRELIACHECDALFRKPPRLRGLVARCSSCGAGMKGVRHAGLTLEKVCAVTVAALITFLIAQAFPVLVLETNGLTSHATLFGAVQALWKGHMHIVAAMVFCTTMLFPSFELVALLYLLLPLRAGRVPRGFDAVLRLVQWVRPWGMTEFFMLGVLITIVKMVSLARVIPGTSLFAFGALTLMFCVIAAFDPCMLWEIRDEVANRGGAPIGLTPRRAAEHGAGRCGAGRPAGSGCGHGEACRFRRLSLLRARSLAQRARDRSALRSVSNAAARAPAGKPYADFRAAACRRSTLYPGQSVADHAYLIACTRRGRHDPRRHRLLLAIRRLAARGHRVRRKRDGTDAQARHSHAANRRSLPRFRLATARASQASSHGGAHRALVDARHIRRIAHRSARALRIARADHRGTGRFGLRFRRGADHARLERIRSAPDLGQRPAPAGSRSHTTAIAA
ncbi:MAG: Paraquat-inducible protein A [uncultured Paraburkholderia sp.]|nr:MAG: Paraquat-inducible protein A [uncultured Paraburkholderia sp.]